jgi:hypothetical protein
MKKIAILFYGLNKSLSFTIDSIKENLIKILNTNGYEVTIFMHTYLVTKPYSNKRSKEKNCIINFSDYKLLNPNYFEFDHLEITKNKLGLEKYRKKGNPWSDKNFQSLDNFILANYSKMKVTKLFQDSNDYLNFDYIIYSRPDLLFLNIFPIQDLTKCISNNILIPNFHLFGKYNINDRFVVCNIKNYKIYGNIFDNLYQDSKKMLLHSETYIGYILAKNDIKCQYMNFYFNRVRANGRISNDFNQSNESSDRIIET